MGETSGPVADVTLERQVLGEAVAWEAFGWFVAAGLAETDFFRDAHRRIWRAAEQVAATGTPPDLVTVRSALLASGDLAEVGEVYLNHLEDGSVRPTWAHVTSVVARLRALTASRRVIAQARQLERDAAQGLDTVPDHLAAIEAAVAAGTAERPLLDATRQLAAMTADLSRDQAGRIYLGLPSLDNILAGIHGGEVLGLMARPGIGKTLLMGHILMALAEGPHGIVVFSLEMSAAQIVTRLARTLYGLTSFQIEDLVEAGTLDAARYEALYARTLLLDTPSLSVAQMDQALRQVAMGPLRATPVRVVFIDHLGLVGGDRRLSTYDRVSTQSREVKELAKRHDVAVVVAVQVNREAGGADGARELTLGACRDSVTGDTPVRLADGALVPIADLVDRPDVRVWAIDRERTPQVVPAPRVWAKGRREVLRVTTQSGRTLCATPEHPLRTADAGWRPLAALGVGRYVAVADGVPVAGCPDLRDEPIVRIEPAGEAEVFDAEVPGRANFLAAGFWVHNSGVVEEAVDYLVGMRRLDRATALDEEARARYRDCLFLRVLKNRHGDLGTEFALRMDVRTLRVDEAPEVEVDPNDARTVAQPSGRRR